MDGLAAHRHLEKQKKNELHHIKNHKRVSLISAARSQFKPSKACISYQLGFIMREWSGVEWAAIRHTPYHPLASNDPFQLMKNMTLH